MSNPHSLPQPSDLTVDQATDLAKHFLGREWFAWTLNGSCILGDPERGARHHGDTWRHAFRLAGVALPVRPHFAAHKLTVFFKDAVVATAVSATFAKRIARALNAHEPNSRGI